MKKIKRYKSKNSKNKMLQETKVFYGSPKDKTIRFFSSFEDSEEYSRKQMAMHSPEQRLQNLEILRKRIFHQKLLPNGKWAPLSRALSIIKGTFK